MNHILYDHKREIVFGITFTTKRNDSITLPNTLFKLRENLNYLENLNCIWLTFFWSKFGVLEVGLLTI